ncbi:MAG TPA: hypothetical protein ENK12_07110 [Gammaproteobacteria bacterium]|nr:hypothetical protein [Gammaproteobacteria bacterium]
MHDDKTMKRGAWLATAALLTEMGLAGTAAAAGNPFRMTEPGSDYQVAHGDSHATAEPARAADDGTQKAQDENDARDDAKAVPEGRCGSEHMKLNEGKCGGG